MIDEDLGIKIARNVANYTRFRVNINYVSL